MSTNNPLNPAGTPVEAYTTGGWRSHIILICLSAIYIFDYADRFVVANMVDYIKRDWQITDEQAGMLMSAILLSITVFGIPASLLIDRWSRRKMVAIMTFFWSLATLSCAFTRNFAQLLVARCFIGMGEAGYAPGGTAMLAAAYPEEKRSRMIGVWNMFIPLGMGIGMLAGGVVARRWGWHHAFGVVSVPGMLLALAAWFLPDYKTVKIDNPTAGKENSFVNNVLYVFRIPSLVFTYLGFAMTVSVTTCMSFWLPTYFERTGLAQPGHGSEYALPVLAVVVVGAPLGGYLSDLWYRRSKKSRLVLPALTSFLSAGMLFLAFMQSGSKAQLVSLVLYGILVTCFLGPGSSVTQEVVHPGLRAFSYAMCVIVQHTLGDIWSPPFIGRLSDMWGLQKAVMFIPLFGVLAAVFFFIGSRFFERDLEKVGQVKLEAEKH